MNSANYISPWIFTTAKCNLSCPYCYVIQRAEDMEERTYQKINEIFLQMIHSKRKDCVIYRIAGGEPLLVFNKWIEYTEEFIEKSNEQGFVSIITNLTTLTDEMLKFFKDTRYSFGISLDGFSYSKPFHDGNSSADTVKNNIDRIINAGNKNIDISSVINKDSFSDIEKLAEWVAERDLNWGIYLDHFFCGEMPLDLIVEKMMNVIDILDSKNYDIYNKMKFSNISINSSYEGCTAGEKLIAIYVNGDIFPCQTTVYGEKICNIFDSADIIEELKRQKKYKLGYNFSLPQKCADCAIKDICSGGCKENNKEINKDYTCDIIKAVILYMMKKWRDKNAKL